jgi:hypothetical protein
LFVAQEKPGRNIAASNRAHLELDGSIWGDDGPLSMCRSTIDKSLEYCSAGMYRPLDSIMASCQCCQAATYSFDANISAHQCLSCPRLPNALAGTLSCLLLGTGTRQTGPYRCISAH